MSAPFRASVFQQLLPHWQLEYSVQTDSTNAQARRMLGDKLIESGTVFVTDSQSAGVGRRGSTWQSAPNQNLLFSIVLETELSLSRMGQLSLMVGLAVQNVVDKYTNGATIKWPNDVYVRDKKIAGILCEQIDGFSIIGVGLNVHTTNFPDGIHATSIDMEGSIDLEREPLLVELISKITEYASLAELHFEKFQDRINKVHYLSGRRVRYKDSGGSKSGEVVRIAKDASLIMKNEVGEESHVYSASELRLME